AGDRDRLGRIECGAVARREDLIADLHRTAGDLQPALATAGERVRHRLAVTEHARIQIDVLMDRHRSVAPVARTHQAEPAALVRGQERLLLVARLDAVAFRLDPNLQEMDGITLRVVELAVPNTGAGRHTLDIAGTDHRTGADAVLVFEGAV